MNIQFCLCYDLYRLKGGSMINNSNEGQSKMQYPCMQPRGILNEKETKTYAKKFTIIKMLVIGLLGAVGIFYMNVRPDFLITNEHSVFRSIMFAVLIVMIVIGIFGVQSWMRKVLKL